MVRISQIDNLRGIEIIAVLIIHTSMNFAKVSELNNIAMINLILDRLAHFAIPLFCSISGYVLSFRYYGGIDRS